jgi:hypothetical protein
VNRFLVAVLLAPSVDDTVMLYPPSVRFSASTVVLGVSWLTVPEALDILPNRFVDVMLSVVVALSSNPCLVEELFSGDRIVMFGLNGSYVKATELEFSSPSVSLIWTSSWDCPGLGLKEVLVKFRSDILWRLLFLSPSVKLMDSMSSPVTTLMSGLSASVVFVGCLIVRLGGLVSCSSLGSSRE